LPLADWSLGYVNKKEGETTKTGLKIFTSIILKHHELRLTSGKLPVTIEIKDAFRHCRGRFYAFVGQHLSKQAIYCRVVRRACSNFLRSCAFFCLLIKLNLCHFMLVLLASAVSVGNSYIERKIFRIETKKHVTLHLTKFLSKRNICTKGIIP